MADAQAKRRPGAGFTIIELLIVVVILSLLATLLIPLSSYLRHKASILATQKKMDAIAVLIGGEGGRTGGAAFTWDRLLGISAIDVAAQAEILAGLSDDPDYPAEVVDPVLDLYKGPPANERANSLIGSPWGKVALDAAIPVDYDPAVHGPESQFYQKLELRSTMNPVLSFFFLWQADVLPKDPKEAFRAYTTDRSGEAPWNDAWGNPIVVAYCYFEPRGDAQTSQDALWEEARRRYGTMRILYLTLASAGPSLRSTAHADVAPYGVVRDVWNHALWVMSRDGQDVIWDQDSFDDPPWNNIRRERYQGEEALLAAPYQLH